MISFKDRFTVTYKLYGSEEEAREKAFDICVEQTVEFPYDLIEDNFIRDTIVGKIESFHQNDDQQSFSCTISYVNESASFELTQLINVIFGNISLKDGIFVESFSLPENILNIFKGPRFGREGLRNLLNAKDRPLIFSALKPMGLSSKELAKIAYEMALGGIDIIKDDHGLTNQSYAPFEERVTLCANAVNDANKQSGNNAIYVPNITASYKDIYKRAVFAKEALAGGLLIAPGITGFDAMREIAEDKTLALPVFSHPALLGSYAINKNGISPYALFGQLTRLAGADATIYPNFGGRFPISKEDCISITEGTKVNMRHIKESFPCPAGGITLDNIPDLYNVYGDNVIYLVGGGLFRYKGTLVESCRYFRGLIE